MGRLEVFSSHKPQLKDSNFALDEVKEIPVDSKGMEFLNSITDDNPTSEPKDSSDDLGLEDLLNNKSSNDLDFKDSIPIDQDTSSFNNLGLNDPTESSPIESDFNFFNNDDIL